MTRWNALPTLLLALTAAAVAPTPATAADAPKIQVVDDAGYDAAIAKYRGKVVVVDFWALWCTECLKEFKYTVGWGETYKDQGLVVVSMSFDDDGTEGAAGRFLAKRNANFQHLRSKWGSGEESFEKWNIPSGTLPHVKIYGRDGKLVKVFDAGDDPTAPSFTHVEVEKAIKAILAASPQK